MSKTGTGQFGFFDLEKQLAKIYELNDFLPKLNSLMGNEVLRSIGFARAKFWIGMRNLMYNMGRFVSLMRPKKVPKPVKVR